MGAARNIINSIVATAVAACLAGCMTVNEGTSQTLSMNVTPVDASCTAWRDGKMVAIYNPAFQSMTVSKSKDPLTILCTAGGYQDAKVTLQAAQPEWKTPVSDAVDYATGALSRYDTSVTVVLEKS